MAGEIKDSGTRRVYNGKLNKSGDKRGCVVTHGMSDTRLYSIWTDMKRRCYNKNNKRYDRYGKRGITVCDEWKNNFAAFADWANKNGYNDELTIERKSIDGNYEPSNCTFIPFNEQGYNTSRSHFIIINNEKKCISQWAKEYNINPDLIKDRINKLHWDPVEAVTVPKLKMGGKYKNARNKR